MFAHHVELVFCLPLHIGLILCLADLHVQRLGLDFGRGYLLGDCSEVSTKSPHTPDGTVKKEGYNKKNIAHKQHFEWLVKKISEL